MTESNEPVEPSQPKSRIRAGLGTLAAGAMVVAAKFKFLLLGLKLLGPSWTFIVSLAFYAVAFGWKLGIVIILSLAAHELGHYFAYRSYGLPARLPVFIPFLGAFTAGAVAADLETDAYIALAGPVTGLALAAACWLAGVATSDPFWYACASLSGFLNLFNMIPILPFDGGRVIGAVWPPLWLAGVVLFVAAAVYLHVPLIIVAVIALLGLPAMWPALRGHVDPRAAAMTAAARARVSLWYVGTAVALVMVLGAAQAALPARSAL
jgi:Zn-dependent protease